MFAGIGSRLYSSTNSSPYASSPKRRMNVQRLSTSHPSQMWFSESSCSSGASICHPIRMMMCQGNGSRLRNAQRWMSAGGVRSWVFGESVVRSWVTTRFSGFWNGVGWRYFLNETLFQGWAGSRRQGSDISSPEIEHPCSIDDLFSCKL